MRVVQVGVFLDPRGRIPQALLDAWPGLTTPALAAAEAGCDVVVAQAAAEDGDLVRDGVRYRFVAEAPLSPTRRRLGRWAAPATPRVTRCVVSLQPDVVHLHGLSFPRHASHLSRALGGVPLLAQDHADTVPPPWRRSLHRRGLAGLAGVLFTARGQAEPFFTAGVLRRSLPVFEVIESTTGFTPPDPDAARARARTLGDPSFLWVGRLDANKDPLTVLDAFSRTVATLPAARLRMCFGDAPLLRRVEARIRADPRLRNRVELLGEVPHRDVERLLGAADFLVLGSHREGSGFAVIEALACGTPPLVTDIPSLRRITGEGAVGALSEPGNAEAMAAAMVGWAHRDRAALRRAAREHFEKTLSLPALGAELRAAYDAVCDGSRGTA